MRYPALSRTGLFVPKRCLGAMTFGGSDGMWGKIGTLQQGDAEWVIGQSVDAGIGFIGAADVYADGLPEKITGQALKNLKFLREEIVVAAKVWGRVSVREVLEKTVST